MDRYKRYYGIIIFVVVLAVCAFGIYTFVWQKWTNYNALETEYAAKQTELNELQNKIKIVQEKIKKIQSSISGAQKKIYSPVESDLGSDTLFFTLYTDVIEMIHANSVKIKSIDYTYNPENDKFVNFNKEIYFVCDVNMDLVSNYTNLGKLIQDIYQYPYYIKINSLEVKPFEKDKKILISKLSLRLYAHTAPEADLNSPDAAMGNPGNNDGQ